MGSANFGNSFGLAPRCGTPLAFLGNLLASMLDPHYLTCPLFALLGVYVLLSLPMDARTPLLVRPHLEKIYPLLVDRFLPVHPGIIIKPLVRCGTTPLHLALLGYS